MKRNRNILIAFAIFYVAVAVLALVLLGGKSSVFNRDRDSIGAKPSAMEQTVIGTGVDIVADVTTDVVDQAVAEKTEEVAEAEEVTEPEPEPEPEPVVYEPRYFSFTTTNRESNLRFRKEPSEDAEIITKLYYNTFGYITKPGNKWCKVVMTTGREGYLATEFLQLTELTEETYPEKYIDLVEAPEEELTVRQFTTDLIVESKEEDSEDFGNAGDGTDYSADTTAAPADASATTTDTTASPADAAAAGTTENTAQP